MGGRGAFLKSNIPRYHYIIYIIYTRKGGKNLKMRLLITITAIAIITIISGIAIQIILGPIA
jgi:hypothetical protein